MYCLLKLCTVGQYTKEIDVEELINLVSLSVDDKCIHISLVNLSSGNLKFTGCVCDFQISFGEKSILF